MIQKFAAVLVLFVFVGVARSSPISYKTNTPVEDEEPVLISVEESDSLEGPYKHIAVVPKGTLKVTAPCRKKDRCGQHLRPLKTDASHVRVVHHNNVKIVKSLTPIDDCRHKCGPNLDANPDRTAPACEGSDHQRSWTCGRLTADAPCTWFFSRCPCSATTKVKQCQTGQEFCCGAREGGKKGCYPVGTCSTRPTVPLALSVAQATVVQG